MKGPTRKDEPVPKMHEPKLSKIKRNFVGALKTQSLPTTFDEAKACCKARKRKERQESISSLCQERKVIRSNSEERPTQKKQVENKNSMRRVSSSEDFPSQNKVLPALVHEKSVSPHKGSNDKLSYEDYEHEKRRSYERFARPLTLKSKKQPSKRLKIRYLSRAKCKPELPHDGKDHTKRLHIPQGIHADNDHNKDNDNHTMFMQLHKEERARSPSPTQTPISPVLDFSTLHEQIDCSEPVLSHQSRQINENTETMPSLSIANQRLLSSPRNSIIATHRIYLDPDIQKMNSNLDENPQNPVDERLQKLSKQINSLKKKIKKYEAEFENQNGYKPSHIEKMNDKNAKKWYTTLSKLKKDQRQLNEVSTNCSLISGTDSSSDKICMQSLQITITEIEKKLTAKREAAQRCFNLEEMTSEQLLDEKVAIQKALLYLESIHGRPNNREDRDIVRPFYDRYRTLKRMVAKIATASASGTELATIHENETMNFITPTSSSQSNDTESEKTTLMPSVSTDSDTDTSIGDNLHSLSREELIEQMRTVTEERKELRRKIKEFEFEVQVKSGKMIQREEKAPLESVYVAYKKTKAKLRLLEALVGKQSP